MSTWGDFMFCNDNVHTFFLSNKKLVLFLPFNWLLGFALGCVCGWFFRFFFIQIFYQNLVNEINFFTQLLILSFTFVLPFFLVAVGCRVLVCSLPLFEGSGFAFVLVGLVAAFPRYGWLLGLLFLLPKALVLILQFFYWRICLLFSASASLKLYVPFLIACLPVLIMKDYLIKPTLLFLLDHL